MKTEYLFYSLQQGTNMNEENNGYKIVLTADRTLMSEYHGGIFLGFSACIPKGVIPDWIYFSMFCPSVETLENGAVKYAPYGTRKIEAALLEYGFETDEIIVAHPERLHKAIGPATRVLGITENDPLGIGPATSTFTQLLGGQAYMAIKFKEILNHPSVKKYKPKVIVGGAGAWQLEPEHIRKELGVHCVVIGEGEEEAGPLFEKAVRGEQLPEVVYGEMVSEEKIPVIRNATIDGLVEIARGCGRGCRFCVPTLQRLRCHPIEKILQEIDVNLKAGRRPLLHAEDVLRYKAKGIKIDKEAVIKLFKTVKAHPGVGAIGISHFALSSVAAAPDLVEEISGLLNVGKNGEWFSGQTGVETGSPRMIRKHMRGKCRPFAPEEWPNMVLEAFEILAENNWVPCATLIVGLPEEKEKDIDLTIQLVEELRPFKSLLVPLFYVAMGCMKDETESFTMEKMTPKHGELIIKCWEHNLEWSKILLKEYIVTRKFGVGYGIRLFLSYGINHVKKMLDICRREYNYDLKQMINDVRSGELDVTPRPIRIINKLINMKH